MNYGDLRSPSRHFVLALLDGEADAIEAAGHHYETVGKRMEWTAAELEKLGNGDKYTAQSLDQIRQSAREVHGDLNKAADRYTGTGPVLVAYAGALRTARTRTVDPLVDDIRVAHAAAEAADDERRAAQALVDDYGDTHFWETAATDAEVRSAKRALSAATTAASGAAGDLDELWVSFESGYSAWEDAYETAVRDVSDASAASGIDDSWWEDALDVIADAAAVIGAVALVIALVATGPFAAIALVVATVVAVIALAAHLTMAFAGSKRVSGWDIVFDIVGVVPFLGAFGKALKGGEGVLGALRISSGASTATRSTLNLGRNSIALDLRAISGAGRGGGRAAREAAAPSIAQDFFRGVQSSVVRNVWNAMRGGGSRNDGMVWTLAERMAGAWPGAGAAGMRSNRWMALHGAMPGPVFQGVNVGNAVNGTYSGLQVSLDQLGIVELPELQDFVPDIDFVLGR